MQKKDGGSAAEKWKALLKKKPGLVYMLYAAVGLFAVLLCLIGSEPRCRGSSSEPGTPSEQKTECVSGKDPLEQRLTEVLGKIRGAGKVDVLITYETGGEIVTATVRQTDEDTKNADRNTGSEASRSVREVTEPATVETENGHVPIVLYEIEPKVRGVIVVAEGASDFSVRQKLQAAVHAVTGIPIERIEVFEMSFEGP